ncbi:FeoA family protein [Oscillochloris trichoides DG-6]|uniref:FeoA family protein n=1 Tax=Oscillochloris trichoides DG-6 TaxID=765420 RepID=E1ICX4_9CHLR|nr:FeoA family protein [Oscillochloris trichoides]EFO80944.1 FeoA family protein [Oscillochloris trichoides DG-6]
MMQPVQRTLPLAMAGTGARVRLVEVTGNQRSARRLAELGMIPGSHLTIMNDHGGTLLIAVGDTRLALGAGVAHSVLVSALD